MVGQDFIDQSHAMFASMAIAMHAELAMDNALRGFFDAQQAKAQAVLAAINTALQPGVENAMATLESSNQTSLMNGVLESVSSMAQASYNSATNSITSAVASTLASGWSSMASGNQTASHNLSNISAGVTTGEAVVKSFTDTSGAGSSSKNTSTTSSTDVPSSVTSSGGSNNARIANAPNNSAGSTVESIGDVAGKISTAVAIAEYTKYAESSLGEGYWRGKDGIFRSTNRGGNGTTGGKLKFAKAGINMTLKSAGTSLGLLAIGAGAYQTYEGFRTGNLDQRENGIANTTVGAVSTFGGPVGWAFGASYAFGSGIDSFFGTTQAIADLWIEFRLSGS